DFVMECSEDGGASWQMCGVEFRPLKDYFGIEFRVDNLAAMNCRSGDEKPTPAASWWGLLKSGTQLRFRLTCAIEADTASRANATRQATAGSVYTLGNYLAAPSIEERWAAPASRH